MTLASLRFSSLLLLPLSIAACGGGDDGSSGSDSGGNAGSDQTGGTSNGGSGGTSGSQNSGGSAGNSQGGSSGSNGGGDTGGTNAGGAGPGIPVGDAVYCVTEITDPAVAFYYGVGSTCYILQVAGGISDEQKPIAELACSTFAAAVVEACPNSTEKTPVAYCAGQKLLAGVTLDVTRAIFESAVNPDAASVARNSLAVCGGLAPYDLADFPLTTSCTGTLTANVDGEPVDFTKHLTCLFRTDGTKTTYFVRGAAETNTLDSQELTLKVIKDGAGEVEYFEEALQPPVGYLEGSTAADTFGFPVDANALMLTTSRYETDGSGFAATFAFGAMSTSPTSSESVRMITDGTIDIHFDVQ